MKYKIWGVISFLVFVALVVAAFAFRLLKIEDGRLLVEADSLAERFRSGIPPVYGIRSVDGRAIVHARKLAPI